jgi:hypothetical protein
MNEQEPRYIMFKLAAGSPFIIAEVLHESAAVLKTRMPLVFTFNVDDEGFMNVNASRFMPFAEGDEVMFEKTAVYALCRPKQSLVAYYIKWRNEVPEGMFEWVEEQMLSAACDPTLNEELDDLRALRELDVSTATRH